MAVRPRRDPENKFLALSYYTGGVLRALLAEGGYIPDQVSLNPNDLNRRLAGGNMVANVLDITPDPKVLLALTHTPIKPLDALCELIDNAIDSFRAAQVMGTPVRFPLVDVTIPGESQARRGEGIVRVTDNGVGLDKEGLANTLRAGFSGKNRFDSLGLFGMGFNIATGKLGRTTKVTTVRSSDANALRVTMDLPNVVRSRKFDVPVEEVAKHADFDHGTIVEVSDWWPEGDPNSGFIAQLAHIPKLQLRQQIGRRYASLLGNGEGPKARIRINQELVVPFEHCVWSGDRFVERKDWGNIPARIQIDTVIYSQRRCLVDGATVDAVSARCLECGSEASRTVEERLRGWVGIQRFDDNNKFGIDLIRNGRAIRVGEKDAFFNYVDDLGESVKEYPTDQQTGRIVGEVHLDHVPVDFTKQDFQRTTEEWQRAVQYLRGGSLLPSRWEEGAPNSSPISKLFQGYRKVRIAGKPDMYMGRFDEVSAKPVRIGREVEQEMYRRFIDRESGYYDDAKWWELVENASVPPLAALEECSECGYQNAPDVDVCAGCERILHSKQCLACSAIIAASASHCEFCNTSQIPEVQEPWRCAVCSSLNGIDDERCSTCEALRGAEDPVSVELLRRESEHLPSYSFESLAFTLADGKKSDPLDVVAYRAGSLKPRWDGEGVPTLASRAPGKIEVFIDESHSLFTHLGVRPQEAVAIEAAQYLHSLRSDLHGRSGHSVRNISATILADVWGENLAAGAEQVSDSIRAVFAQIAERLNGNDDAADFFQELDQYEQRELADRLISAGVLDQLASLRESGAFLGFASAGVLARFFSRYPEGWFGTVWTESLADPAAVGKVAAENSREQVVGIFSRCLDDCAAYLRFSYTDPLIVARVRASLAYLEARLA
ncbi:ATP-binding protein [Marisediminicola senii]|uniref:ATP-binding protein n=1 Tax=Marisediminicola senii TaxID=2711233 RepID=UPI0013EC10CC|nr:ATP-binding protein [Marisediminicola senii]